MPGTSPPRALGAAGDDVNTGKIHERVDHVGTMEVPAGAVTQYDFDSLGRLTTAIEEHDSETLDEWTYTYDDNDNRTEANGTTYTYNAADQITHIDGEETVVTYNSTGDMTTLPDGTELIYDPSTQLRGGTGTDGQDFRNIYRSTPSTASTPPASRQLASKSRFAKAFVSELASLSMTTGM